MQTVNSLLGPYTPIEGTTPHASQFSYQVTDLDSSSVRIVPLNQSFSLTPLHKGEDKHLKSLLAFNLRLA